MTKRSHHPEERTRPSGDGLETEDGSERRRVLIRVSGTAMVAENMPARVGLARHSRGLSEIERVLPWETPASEIVLHSGSEEPTFRGVDLAGEYMEARLRGVVGSAQGDLLAAISVPTSDATPEERELALDIRATLGATRGA